MQGGKSPFSAPHALVKTTSISHFSALRLLLAKRDQSTSTADAPEYAGLVKERGYPLGFPSAPALVVFYYSLSNAFLTEMGRGGVQSFLLSPLLT